MQPQMLLKVDIRFSSPDGFDLKACLILRQRSDGRSCYDFLRIGSMRRVRRKLPAKSPVPGGRPMRDFIDDGLRKAPLFFVLAELDWKSVSIAVVPARNVIAIKPARRNNTSHFIIGRDEQKHAGGSQGFSTSMIG